MSEFYGWRPIQGVSRFVELVVRYEILCGRIEVQRSTINPSALRCVGLVPLVVLVDRYGRGRRVGIILVGGG